MHKATEAVWEAMRGGELETATGSEMDDFQIHLDTSVEAVLSFPPAQHLVLLFSSCRHGLVRKHAHACTHRHPLTLGIIFHHMYSCVPYICCLHIMNGCQCGHKSRGLYCGCESELTGRR